MSIKIIDNIVYAAPYIVQKRRRLSSFTARSDARRRDCDRLFDDSAAGRCDKESNVRLHNARLRRRARNSSRVRR